MAGGLEDDSTWLLALESILNDDVDLTELVKVTKGRALPDEHRAKIWFICLRGRKNKICSLQNFDEIFDLPEQSVMRSECKSLVDKLGNEEEDKVSVICDIESVFTCYCKLQNLKYDAVFLWADIIMPLVAVKMPRDHLYICFENIFKMYIPCNTNEGAPIFHLLRLLLLYHDPELCTFLDSKKISPDNFALQEQILSMGEEPRSNILTTLRSIPAALSVDDVSDFCTLARYHCLRTPVTFRKEYSSIIFSNTDISSLPSAVFSELPLSQALCLPVCAEEILDVSELSPMLEDSDQVCFFLVDCRPSEQYNVGHLPNAFHLDSNLMLQQPAAFQTAVQGLFMVQRQALNSGMPGCGKHLCFIGSGREKEDQYVHMVVAFFLQQYTQFVTLAKGGYHALHDLLVHNINEALADHDTKKCIVCCPDTISQSSGTPANSEDLPDRPSSGKSHSDSSVAFKLSSIFRSKSVEVKDKLIEYITNPYGENAVQERHVQPEDKGKLYRCQEDVFSIHDGGTSYNHDQLDLVKISQWSKKPDVVAVFRSHQVNENGYMYPCHLLLSESLLFIIRDSLEKHDFGHVTARRALSSIVKITSKKKHPDLITFKYGTVDDDSNFTITDMDRFIIPRASDATKIIKAQIVKQIENLKKV